MSWWKGTVLWFVLMAALATSACGAPKGKLYGVVTYAGKPVTGGVILIMAADQPQPIRAPTDEQGNYTASGIPVGPVKIAILPPPPQPRNLPPPPEGMDPKLLPPPAPPDLGIPRKYTDPETSGLTATVTSSAQKLDIELK